MARHESRNGIRLGTFLNRALPATFIATFFLSLFVSNATHASPCQIGDPTCTCGYRNGPPEYVRGPSGPRIYDACENLVLLITVNSFEILNLGWGGPGSSYPEVLNKCRQLNDQNIAQGISTSGCYVVEPGQPDPGVFLPDAFVLTPIPVYNVPIIRYIHFSYSSFPGYGRIIQYGWSGAGLCQPGQTRDPATGACSEDCPVDRLPDFPPANDPCTQSLEAGNGTDATGACGTLTREMQQQEQCLANKIRSLGVPYTRPTSTVRTVAYQDHLNKIWEKWKRLNAPESPEEEQACTQRKKEVGDELAKHSITFEPTPADPDTDTHINRRAVDINRQFVQGTLDRIFADPRFIDLPDPFYGSGLPDYLRSPSWNPPACNLTWGGTFLGKKYDPIHFQLPLP